MAAVSSYASGSSAATSVASLVQGISTLEPVLIVFFSAPEVGLAQIGNGLEAAYPKAVVLGATSAGELATGHALAGSVVAVAFDSASVARAVVAVVAEPSSPPSVKAAVTSLGAGIGESLATADIARFVGLVLCDGLSGTEEALMETLGALTDVSFVGGSAGDSLTFTKTEVYACGKAMSGSAVLALLEPAGKWAVVKTQSAHPTGMTLTATTVDEATRTVIAFDGKPAAEAYAEALGVPVADLAGRFMVNPLGLMVGDEPFVRSPQTTDGESVRFYCRVVEGMELAVLQTTDMLPDTKEALESGATGMRGASGAIVFNCILRTLQLRSEGREAAYAELFGLPMAGFSTYGEQYLGHVNQTATMLLIG